MIASQVVVLVPVLNRPHRVKPLMKSFEASGTPEARLLFIVEEGDEEELDALLMADAQMLVVEPECTTWPHKVNRGYKETADPWLLLAADDVHFHPGWWRATESARQKFGVIGTNDLGNPHVLAGKHTTHPLIARWYAQELGTFDQRDRVVHEGYRHWFVDNELVETAKIRNQWAFCPDAIVEHLHPYWDPTVHWDSTYARGEAHRHQDQELFRSRHASLLQWAHTG
jgi:hypothetical protein